MEGGGEGVENGNVFCTLSAQLGSGLSVEGAVGAVSNSKGGT
jgi:hypothetical protein